MITSVGTLNYLVDPLYCFRAHPGRGRFNDRLQTTNLLHFTKANFDTLLLGSSRVKNLGDDLFLENHTIFNYAAAGMKPSEYEEFIRFAKEENKAKKVKRILIGLDFTGSSLSQDTKNKWKPPREYIQKATAPFYRLQQLFTLDAFLYSTRYLLKSLQNKKNTPVIGSDRDTWNLVQMSAYKQMYERHRYNEQFCRCLQKIVAENQDAEVLFFTTPVSAPLFKELVKSGRLPEYKRWLKDIVKAGGSVTHFMDLNSVTTSPKNFRDENHIHIQPGKLMLKRLLHIHEEEVPLDFGVVLTESNLDTYLAHLEMSLLRSLEVSIGASD